MKNHKSCKFVLMICGLFLIISMAHSFDKVGTTAAPFLKIECGARPVAMGGSFVALANDALGVYYNPAGFAEVQNLLVSGGHTRWFADLTYNYASCVIPTRKFNVCLWGTFLSSGDMEITTIEEPEGTDQYYRYTDGLLSVSLSAFISEFLSVGVSGKYIQQSIFHESAATVAFDIGSIFRTPIKGARIGMCLVNYGGRMQLAGSDLIVQTDPWPDFRGNPDAEARLSTESFPLPMAFKLGLAWDLINTEGGLFDNKIHRFTIALDGIHPNDGKEKLQLGCEYGLYNTLFLRGGYKFNYDTQKYTVGAGINMQIGRRIISIDYAFVDMDVLDSTHRISVTLGL